MRYTQYKGVVEREYKKSLRKIMHEICVVDQLDSTQGALRLGVAKSIFEYWRKFYRLDDQQLLFDRKVHELGKMHFLFVDDAPRKESDDAFLNREDSSLAEFREQVEQLMAYYRDVHLESDGLSVEAANLPLFEFVSELIDRYQSGELRLEAMEKSVKQHKKE